MCPRDLAVVIDYAHTPDALENVLETLRAVAPKRELVCLFGCGGDRDRSKRPEMAAIAEKLADKVIVTSDNPRTEDPEAIIAEIMSGFKSTRKVVKITSREDAIRAAVQFATPGSTILLAGKGHETYQIIGTEKKHFDEREIVKSVL